MPTYDYECDSCHIKFEAMHSIHDEALKNCSYCNQPSLRRLIIGASVIFKGGGFYSTDQSKKSQSGEQKVSSKETVQTSEKKGKESQ